jgi:assimilatory nitrate reductase catalytic subunit
MMAAGGRCSSPATARCPRDWIAAQLGAHGAATEWLAARPSTPAPDRGPIVCVCLGVGEKDIAGAIADGAAVWPPSARPRARAPLRIVPPRPGANAGKMMEAAE